MTPDPKRSRKETRSAPVGRSPDWRELAQAAATEQDPTKVLERARQLIRALDAESQERMEHLHEGKNGHKAAS